MQDYLIVGRDAVNTENMNIEHVKVVPSFQQAMAMVRIDGQAAYSKRIVSDFSWWTFENTDVFQRELTSYSLLNTLQIGPQLLYSNAEQKQLVVQELGHEMPMGEDIKPFLDSLVALLSELRSLKNTGLQIYSAKEMAALYEKKGTAAKVNPVLLRELIQRLENWHESYGDSTSYIHGDLHLGNILSDGKEVSGLIDFEEAIESLPVFDAIQLSWGVLNQWGPVAQRSFNESYEAQGTKMIDLDEWKRFCRFAGLDSQLLCKAVLQRLSPGESQILHVW
jgi:hypothetical protein